MNAGVSSIFVVASMTQMFSDGNEIAQAMAASHPGMARRVARSVTCQRMFDASASTFVQVYEQEAKITTSITAKRLRDSILSLADKRQEWRQVYISLGVPEIVQLHLRAIDLDVLRHERAEICDE